MPTTDGRPMRYEELARRDCWNLLGSRSVGRLAWDGRDGMTVLTMNYALVGDEIVLRTLPYGSVARECVGRAVAFQVDETDPASRTGWSVLARGRLFHEDDDLPTHAVDVWPEGSRILPLRLVVLQVTGRRLLG